METPDYKKLYWKERKRNERFKKEINRLRALLEENRRSSSEEKEETSCAYCGNTYASLEALLRHQRRSKICKRARSLPATTSDPLLEVQKHLGIVAVKRK